MPSECSLNDVRTGLACEVVVERRSSVFNSVSRCICHMQKFLLHDCLHDDSSDHMYAVYTVFVAKPIRFRQTLVFRQVSADMPGFATLAKPFLCPEQKP
jgi:hypothetical protein